MDQTTPAGRPIVDREKTAPFLIRTFLKIGGFHKLAVFEDGPLPIGDEQQIYTWKDATLREVLTTLRASAPALPEYRHPLARFSFRAVYADSATRGRFAQKELGMVYSRDILGEPGSMTAPFTPAARLLSDTDLPGPDERTLDELRFVPGDFLCISVILPKNVMVAVGPGGELAIKGSAIGHGVAGSGPVANGWKSAGMKGDGGWGGAIVSSTGPPGMGRGGGGGHWRGGSDAPPTRGRGGRGELVGRDRDIDRLDRRVPPPRRDSPPPPPRRGGWGGGRDRRSPSRSRSPPRRRR